MARGRRRGSSLPLFRSFLPSFLPSFLRPFLLARFRGGTRQPRYRLAAVAAALRIADPGITRGGRVERGRRASSSTSAKRVLNTTARRGFVARLSRASAGPTREGTDAPRSTRRRIRRDVEGRKHASTPSEDALLGRSRSREALSCEEVTAIVVGCEPEVAHGARHAAPRRCAATTAPAARRAHSDRSLDPYPGSRIFDLRRAGRASPCSRSVTMVRCLVVAAALRWLVFVAR